MDIVLTTAICMLVVFWMLIIVFLILAVGDRLLWP
ncbi:hypothetical protein QIQ44_gp3 [ssRNA phage Zoerhiza.4_10]|uniref:Uncharacterized protein n=2 Tax=Leviviricetes TaxID=2842243 RepID=A0A8S5L3D4_9VIRU|nr:hypothetical protein QIQ44_gp3 [ssRNA phage Zoerhiza.4_10]QDH86816.1 MAG: hypothetical protein H4Rhizo43493_000002 [Leviviridae sp.]DAD52192.1 TPA_asm: hypothetical protein [ssRNA phage Zoerhiza.4_10]